MSLFILINNIHSFYSQPVDSTSVTSVPRTGRQRRPSNSIVHCKPSAPIFPWCWSYSRIVRGGTSSWSSRKRSDRIWHWSTRHCCTRSNSTLKCWKCNSRKRTAKRWPSRRNGKKQSRRWSRRRSVYSETGLWVRIFPPLYSFCFNYSNCRKQLSAARKREPRRSLPSAARSLLDGDAVYDNEFTKMPKLGRRRRKVGSYCLDSIHILTHSTPF